MVTHEIVLSAEERRREVIPVLQGEAESRRILISLEHNIRPVSMAYASVNLYVQKPSGTVVLLPGEKDETNEKVFFILTKSTCSEPGYCRCYLQIVYEDQSELRAEGLELLVLPCDLEDAVEGTSEFSALQEALAQVVFYKEHTDNQENPHFVTAEQVGARPSDWIPTAEEVGARPSDWMPTASAVGARSNTWLPTAAEIGAMEADAVLPVNQGGTGAITAGNARKNLGFTKKLWSGNWSTGSITVPGASDYMLFVFRTRVTDAPQNFTAIGFKVGGDIRLLGGRGQASGSQHIVGIECSASGDVFSDLVVAGVTHTAGGNHGSVNVYNIYEIYGIC